MSSRFEEEMADQSCDRPSTIESHSSLASEEEEVERR